MSKYNKLIVDLKKIKKNINILKNISHTEFYAVVKADCYGMGAVNISKSIEDMVDGFCVANIFEALELRENGIKKDILILGFIEMDDIEKAYLNDISITVYNSSIAYKINKILGDRKIKTHIKIDTGHGRLGFKVNDFGFLELDRVFQNLSLKIEGIFSHLSTADEEDIKYTEFQKNEFEKVLDRFRDKIKNVKIHLSNDAGFIKHGLFYDVIRSGICLYGIYPSSYIQENYNIGLETAFSWMSKISHIKEIQTGESISYGRKFIADKNMKIGTVAIGYADGYKRAISNIGEVLVGGKRAKILGNITMDQFMIDITEIENVKIDDDVVLIGKQGEEEITVYEMAKWSNTISYEIITSISKRVVRIYI